MITCHAMSYFDKWLDIYHVILRKEIKEFLSFVTSSSDNILLSNKPEVFFESKKIPFALRYDMRNKKRMADIVLSKSILWITIVTCLYSTNDREPSN